MNRIDVRGFLLAKCLAAGMLWLSIAPVYLLPCEAFLPADGWMVVFLPLKALLLTVGAGCVTGRLRRPLFGLAIVFAAALAGVWFLPQRPLWLLLFAPTLAAMLFFMPAMGRPPRLEWTATLAGAGIGLYLAASMLARMDIFAGAGRTLSWFFSAYLVACAFFINRIAVLQAAGRAGAAGLIGRNRCLLALCCLIAVPVANLKAVSAGVKAAVVWVVGVIAAVLRFISGLFIETDMDTAGTMGTMPVTESGEPGAVSRVLETVLTVLAVALMTALLLFALYHAARALVRLARMLWQRLLAYTKTLGEGYEDRSEALFHWGDVGRVVKAQWAKRGPQSRPVPWARLSAGEKVRRVYALLLARVQKPNPALTARETLAGGGLGLTGPTAAQLAALYDEARYSGHPVGEAAAEALRRDTGV